MKSCKEVYILDTSAILHTNTLQIFDKECYVSPRVLEEVLDDRSRTIIEIAVTQGKLTVCEPDRRYVELAEKVAKKTGDILKLSDVDLEVIALALQLRDKGLKPLVLTDDFSIMNVLKKLGINYRSIRTKGIKEYRKWLIYCPACGRVYHEKKEKCEFCGATLIKRKVLRRKRLDNGAGGGI